MTTPPERATSEPFLISKQKTVLFSLVVLVLSVSILFFQIAQPFLIAIILAGIMAVLLRPVFEQTKRLVGGREGLASAITLLISIVAVIAPLLLIAYLAVSQATVVIEDSDALLNTLSLEVEELRAGTLELPEWVPMHQEIEKAGPQIYAKIRDVLGQLGSFFVSSLSHLTNGTAVFFLSLFAFLYALFFFLPMQTSVFAQMLKYTGLPADFQKKLDDRIISVSRATIKGSLLIGLVQGALGGLGFWVTGIEGAVFWAVIMAIFAAIPALGATPVVFCGAIYLAFEGQTLMAGALALWAGLVVGSIDNVLRPSLVGKDAGMSDLWIFVSTLGGMGVFGATGLVLGPVVAGVFITVWTELANWISTDDKQPNNAATDTDPPQPPDPEATEDVSKPGTRWTASKAEMEAELEALREELKSTKG